MTGIELPMYGGVMAEQCQACTVCGECGASWAALVLLAVGVYLIP